MNIAGGTTGIVTTSDMHYKDMHIQAKDYKESLKSGSFSEILRESVGKINSLQLESEKLQQKMIYEPESVDIHDVMIAGQKAQIAMMFAKSVRDEAVRSFQELQNMR